jgi:hypothetical protein
MRCSPPDRNVAHHNVINHYVSHQPLHHIVLLMLWNTAKKAVAEDEIVGEEQQ